MEIRTKDDAWRLLLVLFLGQLVAFSMAACSFASSFIANLGVDAPLAQSFCTHLLLTLVYVPILLRRRQKLRIPWYWYLVLAFVDVQGNYLVTEAYQYSSITSVTLLDCWTVVWAIILTWYALGTRYSFWQFLGAGTCVAGLALVLLSDANTPDAQDPNKIPLLGDALVIAGTVCYAFSNVGEEHCVKKNDRVEVVAMLGLFGVLVSTIQISLFAGYGIAGFMFYTITPFVLEINWLYYLAFAVVAIGLIIYSLKQICDSSRKPNTLNCSLMYEVRVLQLMQQLQVQKQQLTMNNFQGVPRTHLDEMGMAMSGLLLRTVPRCKQSRRWRLTTDRRGTVPRLSGRSRSTPRRPLFRGQPHGSHRRPGQARRPQSYRTAYGLGATDPISHPIGDGPASPRMHAMDCR
uniref:Solute carrier family 35 member F2 n=1 Tax=Aegilops tauschii TaxID=37682 RepID=M8BDJ1_AEGTA